MSYEYGLPFSVVLHNGESFPQDADETDTHEVMSLYSRTGDGSTDVVIVTPGPDDEDGNPTEEMFVNRHVGPSADWYVTGDCRLRVEGGPTSAAILLVRKISVVGASPESESPSQAIPPTTRRSRAKPAEPAEPAEPADT